MSLFKWSRKQAVRISEYLEAFIQGQLYTPEVLRGEQDTPDLISITPPVDEAELRIMHISDLHFGAAHFDKREHLLRSVRQLKPHLILVSGDIVDRPRPDYFRDAKEYLNQLADLSRYLLLCPGNHDRHGKVDLSEYMNRLLITRGPFDCKFIEFSDRFRLACFIFSSTPAEITESEQRPRAPFEELKQTIELLIQVRGWVDPAQLQKMRSWRDWLLENRHDAYRESLKIAALHHHPLPTSKSSYSQQFLILLNSGEVLDCLTDLEIDLAFHGHQHDPLIQGLRRGRSDKEMLVLSAGTATMSSKRGDEERGHSVSGDSGFFLVTVGDKNVRVEQYSYVNAFDLEYKFAQTRQLQRPRGKKRFLRYKVEMKWLIEWPSMDWSVIETHELVAAREGDAIYKYNFGCNFAAPFEELGFVVTRKRDGREIERPKILECRTGTTHDSVGDQMNTFSVDLALEPSLSCSRGSDDELTFSFKWPRGFEDLKMEGRVQSEISYEEELDEFLLEVELRGDRRIRNFLVLPKGDSPEDGLIDPGTGNLVRYRKVGVPKGLVFNYQLTHD